MKRKLPALLLLIAFLTGGAYYWNRQRQEPATKDLLTKNYFKERNPKESNIWYFRINKKYRAW